ncbi:MAG: PCMD domain-containing protein [Alistipes sp.]
MKYLMTILISLTALFGVSCIENDVPHPVVALSIFGVQGEGFTVSSIDVATRTVTLQLDEQTDIQNVQIDGVSFDATIHSTSLDKQTLLEQVRTSRELTGRFDLRTPIYVTLSLYQDYDWTICAEQTIDRQFIVAGQVGATQIDVNTRTVTAYVAKDADLSHVVVSALKLGPAPSTTYSPTAEQLSGTSFETVRFVDVTLFGRTERWLLYVLPTTKTVSLAQADAWSRILWLYGTGIEGVQPMGFRYKKSTETAWLEVPNVTIDGGSFTAHPIVEPLTSYDVVAYCGEEQSAVQTLTTEGELTLVNGGFEEWSIIKDIIYPFADPKAPYWGTGNKGAAIADETLTDKCDPRPGSAGQFAADLKSKFVNIAGIGKFAAGNLFVGDYVRNAGTNGIITFGRPFTLRPTALRIWVKYTRGMIDKIKSVPAGMTISVGDPDLGVVYIALGTWTKEEYGLNRDKEQIGTDDSPLCIDTRDVSTLFNPRSRAVVGYGEKLFTESVTTWTQVTIPIHYNATDLHPTHLVVVCSASRWGDYFTGSTKSEMWLDDFELLYD